MNDDTSTPQIGRPAPPEESPAPRTGASRASGAFPSRTAERLRALLPAVGAHATRLGPGTGRRGWPWWAEAALVATVTALTVQDAVILAVGHGGSLIAVALVAGPALLSRFRWPLCTGAVTAVAAGGWGLLLPLLVAVFHLASRGRQAAALVCAGVALGLNALVEPALDLWTPRAFGQSLLLLLTVALGLWAGGRRRLIDALAERVESLRTERALRERAARLEERSAIAAEMHDVLAHRLSLIALHTGVLAAREDTPQAVSERLALLRTASTEALGDLRGVLGALRDDAARSTGTRLSPVPQDVGELVQQAREAGQEVDLHTDGEPAHAPATHRLAVYRVVREGLTNARRHASGNGVRVRVRYGPPATRIEITNSAEEEDRSAQSGYGLVGLRERVEALGGELEAGPAAPGTWRVLARVPHPIGQNGNSQ